MKFISIYDCIGNTSWRACPQIGWVHVLELGQCRGGSHLDGQLSSRAAEPEGQCQACPCYSKEKCRTHEAAVGRETQAVVLI